LEKELTSELRGAFEFNSVPLATIVDMKWETWDQSKDLLTYLPTDVALNEYLESLPHSSEVAARFPSLSKVTPLEDVTISLRDAGSPQNRRLIVIVDKSTWKGGDILHGRQDSQPPKPSLPILCTGAGKKWLQKHDHSWLTYEPCEVRNDDQIAPRFACSTL
jgi:hypothetical protein